MSVFPLMPVTMDLKEELMEQLELETVFTIPYINVEVDESTVVSWIIMAVFTVLAIILTRNLKVEGKLTKKQLILEVCMEKLINFFDGILAGKGKKYAPWLMSMAIFIGASNIIGIFGFKPPTKSMQSTAAMAITSIILVEIAGIRERGLKGHLKSWAYAIWQMISLLVTRTIILYLGVLYLFLSWITYRFRA